MIFKPLYQILIIGILFFIFQYNAFAQVEVKKYFKNEKKVKEIYEIDSVSGKKSGNYISYFLNGNTKISGEFLDDKQVNLWTYFYENGRVKLTTKFDSLREKSSNQHYQRFYYESSALRMEGFISNKKRVGEWVFYYEGGRIKQRGYYKDGIKQGNWFYYPPTNDNKEQQALTHFENGVGTYKAYEWINDSTKYLAIKGQIIDDKSEGNWTYFYPNKKVKAEGKFVKGKKAGNWVQYYPSGIKSSTGRYQDGKKVGKWKYFHENGKISSEGEQYDQKKEGFWKLYHKSGAYKGDGNFHDGSGTYKEYHPNGSLKMKGEIIENKSEGRWKYYYENGDLEGICEFEKGKGEFTGYYKGGGIRMKGIIQDGKNVGLWTLYDNNGNVSGYYKTVYKDGKEIKQAVDENGRVDQNKETSIPDYVYKNKQNRYYSPKINEFKTFIIGTNPFASVFGKVPLSVEYYIQERLGFEVLMAYNRTPFFLADNNIPVSDIYRRGFEVDLRHKLYQNDKWFGMFYFAHAIEYKRLTHFRNLENSTASKISLDDNRVAYWFSIGDRYMRFSGSPGFTFDAFIGVGIGYRYVEENFNTDDFPNHFEKVKKDNLYIPFKFGLNIGWVFKNEH